MQLKLKALWQESNLRPCDSGAALNPTELDRVQVPTIVPKFLFKC